MTMPLPDWDSYKNFAEEEFRCRCGCGRADMHPVFMERLQMARDRTFTKFIVTSGFRCPDYNNRIASTGRNGPHTTGRAVDLLCAGTVTHNILQIIALQGFTGIGLSQKGDHGRRFIHLDDLPDGDHPRPWVWTY